MIVAAGAASGQLVPELGVRAVKGQLLHLRGEPLLTRTIRGVDAYLVPRGDGRLIVGATVEEKVDDVATAGGVYELLRAAYELLPGVTELEFTEVVVGLRPATPDNAPVIGRWDDRVIVATGHYRNGILLSPVTADLVVELIATGGCRASVWRSRRGGSRDHHRERRGDGGPRRHVPGRIAGAQRA